MGIAEMDQSKMEFLEQTQNAKVDVVDLPRTVQVENRQRAGHEHKHMHGGLEEAARNDPEHSTVIPDHRTVGQFEKTAIGRERCPERGRVGWT